jgi:hypothetical protein
MMDSLAHTYAHLNWLELLELALFVLLVIFVLSLLIHKLVWAQDKKTETTGSPATGLKPSWKNAPEVQLLILALPLHLLWEIAQFPLYTIWHEADWGSILYALVHCTLGDLLIMLGAFWGISILNKSRYWMFSPSYSNVVLFTVSGLAYTVYSEIVNTRIKDTWAYTELMPIVPVFEVGGTPFLQWLLIPPVLVGLINLQKMQLHPNNNDDE